MAWRNTAKHSALINYANEIFILIICYKSVSNTHQKFLVNDLNSPTFGFKCFVVNSSPIKCWQNSPKYGYSRMDQVKFEEDSLYNIWSDMICLLHITWSHLQYFIKYLQQDFLAYSSTVFSIYHNNVLEDFCKANWKVLLHLLQSHNTWNYQNNLLNFLLPLP